MKKELSNADAELMYVALRKVAESKADIPVRAGFRILQNIRALEAAVNLYRSENDRIIRSASGGREKFDRGQDPEAFDKCRDMLKELASVEIEVEIAEVDAADIADLKAPMASMPALEFMTRKEPEKEEMDNG